MAENVDMTKVTEVADAPGSMYDNVVVKHVPAPWELTNFIIGEIVAQWMRFLPYRFAVKGDGTVDVEEGRVLKDKLITDILAEAKFQVGEAKLKDEKDVDVAQLDLLEVIATCTNANWPCRGFLGTFSWNDAICAVLLIAQLEDVAPIKTQYAVDKLMQNVLQNECPECPQYWYTSEAILKYMFFSASMSVDRDIAPIPVNATPWEMRRYAGAQSIWMTPWQFSWINRIEQTIPAPSRNINKYCGVGIPDWQTRVESFVNDMFLEQDPLVPLNELRKKTGLSLVAYMSIYQQHRYTRNERLAMYDEEWGVLLKPEIEGGTYVPSMSFKKCIIECMMAKVYYWSSASWATLFKQFDRMNVGFDTRHFVSEMVDSWYQSNGMREWYQSYDDYHLAAFEQATSPHKPRRSARIQARLEAASPY
jgi:hypothetical protein